MTSTTARIARAITTACVLFVCALSSLSASTEKTLHNFVTYAHGSTPQAAFIADAAGNLYTTTEYGGAHGLGAVIEMTASSTGWTEQILYSFLGTQDGRQPVGSLVFDAAGNLYGTTVYGGTNGVGGGYGTVFELSPSSSGKWTFKLLHTFGRYADGRDSVASLVFDAAGNLYGTTSQGGTHDVGAVFKMSPTASGSWTESVIYSFDYQAGDGIVPQSGLVIDSKGNLYGTNIAGPRGGGGTVFELSPSGNSWTESILHIFGKVSSDGTAPLGGLTMDASGNLYGTAEANGARNAGVVFELVASTGWSENILYSFTAGSDGGFPVSGVTFDAAGNLYGTTYARGSGVCFNSGGCGAVYELSPVSGGWQETTLHTFAGGPDGGNPAGAILIDSSGNLYGTTGESNLGFPGTPAGGTAFKLMLSGGSWVESVYNFFGTDGDNARGVLIQDNAGNLYGTTVIGGAYGLGSVYELSPTTSGSWTNKILYSFQPGTDGENPYGKLVFDGGGNLYGTTEIGGTAACFCGTVFELSPSKNGTWSEQLIHSFSSYPDGNGPMAGLTIDAKKNLYGTTQTGGSIGYGTVFELTPGSSGWTESILHNFGASGDGIYPVSVLTLDAHGTLFGTTREGSTPYGTVFNVSPSSGGTWTEKVLYTFTGGSDGGDPLAGVILDHAGNLYGTTLFGGSGCSYGCGVVYELTPVPGNSWSEQVIYAFTGGANDGQLPESDLVFDREGDIFGTVAASGGGFSGGNVFELTPSSSGWTESLVYTFASPGGNTPLAGLAIDLNDKLYGTTSSGGAGNTGSVFEITP
jgi:uncharacterized repeat protein (TIGR03803 family)